MLKYDAKRFVIVWSVSKGSYYHQLLTQPDKYIFVMILLKNSLTNEAKSLTNFP